jgi:putative transposase
VLTHFGGLKAYRAFMREGVEKKRVPDLDGGGLVRSLGGLAETMQQRGDPVRADARILGTGDFVKTLLEGDRSCASQEERRKAMTNLIERHCERAGILPSALRGGNRAGIISALRAELAYALARDLGIPYAEIGRQLGISTSGVSRIMRRREDKSC